MQPEQKDLFGDPIAAALSDPLKLKRFQVSGKIIKLPFSVWKDGRMRVDVSAYGKGEVVSRNKLNLAKRVRELLANALAETDELIAAGDVDPRPRQRNKRVELSAQISEATQLVFFRPADYKREFSNCPRPVDRMIGPTHLQKRLFALLWSEAKRIGSDFCRLIFASAARELGATEIGIQKSAYSLRDWGLIWFKGDRQKPGPKGGTAVKFPYQEWMGPIPQHSYGITISNPQHSYGKFPNSVSGNPQHSFGACLAADPPEKREKREKSTYHGPDWS